MSSVKNKTIELGVWAFLSKFLGGLRELLLARFIGAGVFSDAFFTAFNLINSLRSVFADGALGVSSLPTIVRLVSAGDKKIACGLISLLLFFFESVIFFVCGLGIWFAPQIIFVFQPGFSPETIALAIPFFRLLMPMIFFITANAILTTALHSVNHFTVPAMSPTILNIFFLVGIFGAYFCNSYFLIPMALSINLLCVFLVAGVIVQFILHLIMYFKQGFIFCCINRRVFNNFKTVINVFWPSVIGASIGQFNFLIDTRFASYLQAGSVSLISYANKFVDLPLTVFASSFATIMLPSFSRVALEDEEELSFLVQESFKLILWVTLPMTLFFFVFAEKFFTTMLVSKRFTLEQAVEAGMIFKTLAIGIFALALQKIVANIYYSKNQNYIITISGLSTLFINVLLNNLLVKNYGAMGLTFATTVSQTSQTLILVFLLQSKFGVTFNIKSLSRFLFKVSLQMLLGALLFGAAYLVVNKFIMFTIPESIKFFLLNQFGYWLWVGPLSCLLGLFFLISRKSFGINLFFMDGEF
ncbi:MAG: Integral membrane protein MviN [candidate division TM6 bacterium GW2011_GWF2_32_72]|nr:MAG: Integral membrane protein MviN [candidate division TM6 bacterium GW2011_GWF2_32_72]